MPQTSDDDDEEVVVVCGKLTTPLYIADNLVGACSECGEKLQFRPHAPAGRKMCPECAIALMRSDTKVMVPQRMLDDLKTYYAKRRH